jgi:hypothetical protein
MTVAPLPTDEELAIDAEQLAAMAGSILEIAARWQARFPSSRILADTVEQFLQMNQAASAA